MLQNLISLLWQDDMLVFVGHVWLIGVCRLENSIRKMMEDDEKGMLPATKQRFALYNKEEPLFANDDGWKTVDKVPYYIVYYNY